MTRNLVLMLLCDFGRCHGSAHCVAQTVEVGDGNIWICYAWLLAEPLGKRV